MYHTKLTKVLRNTYNDVTKNTHLHFVRNYLKFYFSLKDIISTHFIQYVDINIALRSYNASINIVFTYFQNISIQQRVLSVIIIIMSVKSVTREFLKNITWSPVWKVKQNAAPLR